MAIKYHYLSTDMLVR